MSADFPMTRRASRIAAVALAALAWTGPALAVDPEDQSRIRRAISYLDARQEEWSRFEKAQRGEGAEKTACVSCHSGIGYALARPGLGAFLATPDPSPNEQRVLGVAGLRVEHWADLDTPQFELMYDFEERKKVESRGTEAVVNALLLALDDAARGRKEPGPATRTALKHLWETQLAEGDAAGAWDWLNFGLEPWEAKGSRPFGASLAAIAVGSAPGYLGSGLDETASKGVRSLRDYLGRRFPSESLFNRLWILEASAKLGGPLSSDQKREVVDQLLAARREDGGWALADLGSFKRGDGTPLPRDSDGYATGLALRALLLEGSDRARSEVARGVDWLRTHQAEDGSWPGHSPNKKRDPSTFVGKLMTDAATATAALALIEAGSR